MVKTTSLRYASSNSQETWTWPHRMSQTYVPCSTGWYRWTWWPGLVTVPWSFPRTHWTPVWNLNWGQHCDQRCEYLPEKLSPKSLRTAQIGNRLPTLPRRRLFAAIAYQAPLKKGTWWPNWLQTWAAPFTSPSSSVCGSCVPRASLPVCVHKYSYIKRKLFPSDEHKYKGEVILSLLVAKQFWYLYWFLAHDAYRDLIILRI